MAVGAPVGHPKLGLLSAIIDGELQPMNVNLRSPRKSFLLGCKTPCRKSAVTAILRFPAYSRMNRMHRLHALTVSFRSLATSAMSKPSGGSLPR